MPKRTISNLELEQLLMKGKSVSEISKILGVTPGAVSKRIKALNVAVTKAIGLRSAHLDRGQ